MKVDVSSTQMEMKELGFESLSCQMTTPQCNQNCFLRTCMLIMNAKQRIKICKVITPTFSTRHTYYDHERLTFLAAFNLKSAWTLLKTIFYNSVAFFTDFSCPRNMDWICTSFVSRSFDPKWLYDFFSKKYCRLCVSDFPFVFLSRVSKSVKLTFNFSVCFHVRSTRPFNTLSLKES